MGIATLGQSTGGTNLWWSSISANFTDGREEYFRDIAEAAEIRCPVILRLVGLSTSEKNSSVINRLSSSTVYYYLSERPEKNWLASWRKLQDLGRCFREAGLRFQENYEGDVLSFQSDTPKS